MSPWWNKFFPHPYDVLVTSEEIVLSQSDKTLAVAGVPPPQAGEVFETQVARALATVLTEVAGTKSGSTNIWLSHSLVWHGMLGIDARTMSASDIAATLNAYWEDALDLPAAGLALAYQVQPYGRSIFSSCCDMALIKAIQAALKGTHWKIKSIAPHLAKTWNESRKQVQTDDCYLLVHQDKVLSIGVYENGQWTAWTSEGCDNADWAELSSRATRFSRHTGLSDCKSIPVWIYAPKAKGNPDSAGLNNWSLLNSTPRGEIGA